MFRLPCSHHQVYTENYSIYLVVLTYFILILEKEQLEFLSLSKERITVGKSTLKSLNSTLLAVSENERMLSRGLDEMAKHVSMMVKLRRCSQELQCCLQLTNITRS